MMQRLYVFLGAGVLWAMAVLGAIAAAVWLALEFQTGFVFVVVVALIAIVGAFIPAVQLGNAHLNKK